MKLKVKKPNTYQLTIVMLAVILFTVIFKINGSTGFGRIDSLNKQIAKQQIEVDTYIQRNQLMSTELQSLRTDKKKIEELARWHFGMIKPNEVFIQSN